MVVLPAGEFTMGSPESEKGRNKDEGPQRKVDVRPAVRGGQVRGDVRAVGRLRRRGRLRAQAGRRDLGARQAARDQRVLGRRQAIRGLARQEDGQALPAADGGGMGVRGARRDQGVGRRMRPSPRARRSTTSRPTTTPTSSTATARRASIARRRWTWDRCRATPSASTTCTATSGSGSRTATRTAMPARRRTARPCTSADCSSAHPARRLLELLSPASALRVPLRHRWRHPRRKCGLPGCQGPVASCNQPSAAAGRGCQAAERAAAIVGLQFSRSRT